MDGMNTHTHTQPNLTHLVIENVRQTKKNLFKRR